MGTALRWSWLFALSLLFAPLVVAAPIDDPALKALLDTAPSAKDYPGAHAVCLLREMEITIDANGGTVVRDRKLVTLLTPQGLSLAQWSIPYDKSCETVEVRKARTLVQGQAYPLNPTQVVESAVYPGMAWYDALTLRRFPLPGAMVGATLEVETLFKRPTPRIPGEFSARLPLQMSYPVRELRYTLRAPAAMPLTVRFAGIPDPALETTDEGGQRITRWRMTDVPAFKVTEAQTPPAADLMASARVCSMTSWAPVAQWYAKLTEGRDALTPELSRLAKAKTKGCKTPEAKLAALHKVVRELPYIGIEFGTLSDLPHTPKEVAERQYGDCKDKATLLRGLLKVVGVSSDYVLVRTNDRGALDRACYSPAEFNHVILAVRTPDGDHFVDATPAECPADLLPSGVEGAEALIIRGNGELVTLPVSSAAANRTEVTVTTTVKADGSAGGQAVLRFTGLTAMLQRSALAQVEDDRYREALEPVLAARLGGEATITALKVEHLREPEQPLAITADFFAPKFLQPAGDGLSTSLPLFMYQTNRYRSVTARLLPFTQGMASSFRMQARVTFPDGITITHLPDVATYAGPVGAYGDTLTRAGQTLTYTCEYATIRGTFPPETLEEYRKFAALLALEGRNGLQVFVKRE
ncbi:MAG: hypothetical protein BWY76_02932 [bacterium ADurb.Bin429]|nr:MAG: hypothetical protein BWY76_02932 [bacterium ADurb.Bin429]